MGNRRRECGQRAPVETPLIAPETVREEPIAPVAQPEVNDPFAPVYAPPASSCVPVAVPELPKKKSKLPWIIACMVGILAIVAAVVVLLLPSKQDKAIEQAEEYLAAGQYRQAIEALEAVEENDDVEAALTKVYKAVESEIKDLISDEEYDDALEMLKAWTDLQEYDSLCAKTVEKAFGTLLEEGEYVEALELLDEWKDLPDYQALCDEGIEKAVTTMMNDGKYIDAYELLKNYPDAESYTALRNQMMAETVILQCAFNYRPLMKNPSSLQISEAELYVYGGTVEADYPQVILHTSGQNGFGGYATSWSIYDAEDLEYVGSTSTLSVYDADDYYEALVIGLIDIYRDYEEIEAEFDLSRINGFLQSGKKPDIDPKLFAEEQNGGTAT